MKLLSILGPTGSGKSALAIHIAKILNAEIVSCDSMMVYQGMDIGTAKPSSVDRSSIPHHLIDIVGIKEPYDVTSFVKDAKICLGDIKKREKVSIMCGGTGLYAKALLYGYTFYPKDKVQAEEIESYYWNGGREPLIKELQRVDPNFVDKVKDNPRRLIRAVEILRLTGNVPNYESSRPNRSILKGIEIVLLPQTSLLRKRIENRAKDMLDQGWIEETERLVAEGLLSSPTASKCIGYEYISDYLKGKIPKLSEVKERIIHSTCQYAKRQRTWFRHQHPNACMIELEKPWRTSELADKIIQSLKSI